MLFHLWFMISLGCECFQEYIGRVATHKLLPLMYQLAARMSVEPSSEDDLFQPTLDQV